MLIVNIIGVVILVYVVFKLVWGISLYNELVTETLNEREVMLIKPMFFEILLNYSKHLNTIYDLRDVCPEEVEIMFASLFDKKGTPKYTAALIYGINVNRQVTKFEAQEKGDK